MGRLFPLGRVVATVGALRVMEQLEEFDCLQRHASGDWGNVPAADARENELSVKRGYRIISSYPVGDDGQRIWIITEADRSSTCILLPEEY